MLPYDVLAEVLEKELSDHIDKEVLKRVLSKTKVRKKLYKKLAEGMLYVVLREGKLNLPPGFGSIIKREIREKEKKIFNKKSNTMETRIVKGSKLVLRPGETIKQLL